MSMKLFIGGLSYDTSEDQLNTLFKEHGDVVSAVIIKDRFTGNSKGFGFVEMTNIKEGQNAIKALNDKEIDGRKIIVNQARPRNDSHVGAEKTFRR